MISKIQNLSAKDMGPIAIVLAVIVSVLFLVSMVEAATTLNLNINTGGTLTVDGASTLTGAVTATAGITSGSNIISDADSTDNLGSASVRWLSTFSDNFTGNTITLDGGSTVNVFTITDNVADALSIIDSSGDLLVFDTRTGAEVFAVTPNSTFAGTVVVTGAVTTTAGITSGSDIVSDTTSTDSLGVTGTRWLSTFSDNFTGSTITLDGGSTVNVLTITDNVADALSIIDSSGDLLVFDTRTDAEVFAVTPNSTFSGTLTVTGDVIFDTKTLYVDVTADGVGFGTTTPSDLLHVENSSATSTLIISSGASAVGGRIILEDHDGDGCSEIAILDGNVAAKTVTCPANI